MWHWKFHNTTPHCAHKLDDITQRAKIALIRNTLFYVDRTICKVLSGDVASSTAQVAYKHFIFILFDYNILLWLFTRLNKTIECENWMIEFNWRGVFRFGLSVTSTCCCRYNGFDHISVLSLIVLVIDSINLIAFQLLSCWNRTELYRIVECSCCSGLIHWIDWTWASNNRE